MKGKYSLPAFAVVFSVIMCACSGGKKGQDNQGASVNTVTSFKVGGHVGDRLGANEKTWLQPLLENNPNMFGAFLDPDSNNLFKCMWHGEFPGKILTGLGQTYLTSRDNRTKEVGDRMVELLGRSQWDDGYLGPWPASERFENKPEKWDTWGHYHCMYGLYQWYKITGNKKALDIALKAADCIYNYFIKGGVTFASQNWGECNFAVSHIMALLYQQTGDPRYLETAEHIVRTEWKTPYHDFYTRRILTCDWLDAAKAGIPFCDSNQKRWESLYTLTTLATLYQITGNREYYDAMQSLWWGIVQFDRHNTGSFGTGEGADGDIYGMGSETCNTVAWMTFSTEYLKLCKDPYVADELELSYFNATLGSQLGDKEFVYMNSSDGKRISSQIELAPHGYEGGREMNCCQANGNRGLSQFTQWGALTDDNALYLNYYGESEIEASTPSGNRITISQSTDYPRSGKIDIVLLPEKPEKFALKLRIPVWAENARIWINGEEQTGVMARSYYTADRKWKKGDRITLELDMAVHYWIGAGKMAGKTSLYYGPVLLSVREAADKAAGHKFLSASFNGLTLNRKDGRWLCGTVQDESGNEVLLEDYATKPAETDYTTWLNIDAGLNPLEFSRDGAPIWNNR